MPKLAPVSPGEILQDEFLTPLAISQNELARRTAMPPSRINEIIKGKRPISAEAALRFARFFGTSAEFWLNLQRHYDLEISRDRLGSDIKRDVKPLTAKERSKATA